ncbi:hypothetical protein BN946_scf184902.g26 [Trametes cinnabarina]|uniref:Yeast cell wall synthesis Kre9/Knh1-like N-terminal domain-containing protein n=1 Tax=Pycnoporus cinnabarinus TaxID=5643 RepID=A0A060SSH3_PYCCI|nr:hypothetical protein BN946_scf184902.g26 [Trametes cinnabarina]
MIENNIPWEQNATETSSKARALFTSRPQGFSPFLPPSFSSLPQAVQACRSLFKMRFSLAALALPIAVTNALQILSPSSSSYWVQNTSNTITWQFSQGDPSPISITVVNANNATLNGAFSIANFVNVSTQTFTVTNVTLRPGDHYQVQFVNTSNITQVFAHSDDFSVKPPGTAPAPVVSASATSSGASASSTAPSGTSSTSSASASAQGNSKNGAISLTSSQGVFGVIAACAVASLSALLL